MGTPLMKVIGHATPKDGLCFPFNLRFPFLQSVTVGLIVLTVVIAVMGDSVSDQQNLIFSIVLLTLSLVPWFVLVPGKATGAEGMQTPLGAPTAAIESRQ